MRLLLSRGDVIAPCKSSDDEESLSIQRPESAAATTPRRKLHAILLKEDEAAGAGKKDSVVRPKYRFMKTKDSAAAAEPTPSSTKPAPTRNNNKASSASAAAQAASAPAAAVHNTRTPGPKKKPAVATSPTHALASKQSVSPRSSPCSGAGAGARAGLQSPENDGRGGRAMASSNADKLLHPRLTAMAEDCSSPRFVRRTNLGAAKSKSGELGLAKNKSGELGLSLQRVPTRSGELGLTRPVEGGRNKSGEIVVSKPPSARNVAQQSSSSASPRSPTKVEKTKQQQQQQPPSPARVEEECRPQPAPASPPPPPPVATAPPTAAAPKGRRVVEAINLQDLEAGRVTDFDAASYDFAPGQAVHPEGKQQQFWLTPASDTDDDESSSEVFDPFCIPTTSACGAAAAGGVGGGGVPATTPTKPHKANDPNWEAVRTTRSRDGVVGLSHFRLLKRLGCGDIGSVYLAELRATSCYFAMKVMDKGSLDNRKKQERAQTERQILELLDHPFLPTLYAHFDTPQFTCLVMEFCPGGDLHSLRQSQPGKCFTNNAARFYAAEVLLALEYLHMMGVVYRDLKPENVLVRKDGHIMLSDFDLSLKCDVSPTLLPTPSSSSSLTNACMSPLKRHSFSSTYNHHVRNLASCIMPVCRIPTCTTLLQPPCVSGLPPNSSRPHLARRNSVSSTSSASSSIQASLYSLSGSFRRKHLRRESFNSQVVPLPELVAEPTEARSMSFVGTHEYLAPEIISGDGHGSAVDWWTFGIFLFELLYGKTPFRGSDNQSTLRNVLTQSLRFPDQAPRFDQEEDEEGVSEEAQSLVRGLLTKDPQRRLGSARGAAEIKAHPFFECVNWALIRCATPPEVPKAFRPPESVKTVGGRTPPPSPVADWDAALGPDSDVDFGDLF